MNQLAALLRDSDQPAPKPSPLAALLDPQFRADVGANAKSFLQGLNNGIASNINGPVDLLALLSRKIGLPTPDKPVLGSEWMRHHGLIAEPTDKLTGMFGDVAGNVLPFALMTKTPQIARGLLAADEALQPTVARMADKYMDKTGMRLGIVENGMNRLPFLQEAETAYSNAVPKKALDVSGNPWDVRVDPAVNNVTFWRNGGGREISRSNSLAGRLPHDANHGAIAANIFRLADEKRIARQINSELMAPPPAVPVPEWARILGNQNTVAAGPEWWNQTLKNKANASFDAFADAAKDTPLMLYGKGSNSLNAAEVANAFPGVTAKQSGGDLLFSGANGNLMVMGANTENPVIRSTMAGSQGIQNGGGKELYQAAYNWAGNNKKIINPDTGLTDINQLRKLGNVLSSQIRTGEPIANMNAGGLTGIQGIPQLWQAESKLAAKRAPEIKDFKFNGESFNMKDMDILQKISAKDPNFERGVGLMTAKRAALAEWLKTASPEQAKKAATALAAGGSGAVFADTKD